MCTKACLKFGFSSLGSIDIKDKAILEVGSYNVNGSLRDHVLALNPQKYIGVDLHAGPCVDVVCNADDILNKFGKESFDVVFSTEMMEHVEKWQLVISNMKNICKQNGTILITTRSKGFGKHDYPSDYWRFEIEDMKVIFSDCEILKLEKDPRHPGVFIKVKKPVNFIENDLTSYKLYRME